ncbi:MAG: hypothetical protein RL385_1947 [Pseudomonadota bacterium]
MHTSRAHLCYDGDLSVLRLYAIALNTYREAVRDRVLAGVLGFACLFLLFTLAVAELSLHEQARVVSDVGLAAVSLFSVLMAVFLGSSLLYKEIERKTLYVILPKPLSRTEFLLGKFAGIVLTVGIFLALMGGVELLTLGLEATLSARVALLVVGGSGLLFGVLSYRLKDIASALLPVSPLFLGACAWVGASEATPASVVLAELLLFFGEVTVITAVALLFSSFSTPFLTGLFTLGVWILGRSADDMGTMKSRVLSEGLCRLLHGLSEVVPNFQLFVPARALLYGEGPMPLWHYVGNTMAYGLLYAALMLAGAIFLFKRRDFL